MSTVQKQQNGSSKKKKSKANTGNEIAIRRKGPTDIKIVGQGGYSLREILHAALSAVPKGTFSAVGSSIGGALGGAPGAIIGGGLGKGLAAFTGYGEYILNDIISREGGVRKPEPNTARRIVHSEFIRDINSPGTNFTLGTTLAVNPGDGTVFPWLAPIAQRFTKYKFQQLVFEYRSTTSEYSANSALGSVILAPNYNPIAAPPSTKPMMESMTGAISSKPSNSLLCGVECATRSGGNPERWVRSPSSPVVSQLTDICDLYVATSGLAATSGTALGELWVHYTVDLFEPYYSPSSVYGTGGQKVLISTTGNNIASGFGNIGLSGNTFTDSSTPGLAAVCFSAYAGQPPSTVAYVVSLDTTTPGRIWFGRAGLYQLNTKLTTATAFSAQSGACWTFAFSDTAATLTKPAGASESGSFFQAICEHVISIPNPGTYLQYTYNSVGWGTAPNTSSATTELVVLA